MTTTTAISAPAATQKAAEAVVWLHGDHLSAANPALTQYPDAPVVFVFDEAFLGPAGLAFHRLFFLYEAVVEVFAAREPGTCSVRRGSVTDEVVAFAREHRARRIVTTDTIGDRFAEYLESLEAHGLPVETIPVPSLVPYDGRRAPKRFSAWWREVEADALRP
ncbi:MAG: hypothetical protein H7Z41_00915 [Cytophagales bacterium]|nr:hypothetical protein [Armatimonadota bacterium]